MKVSLPLIVLSLAMITGRANAQCPAVGNDTNCGIIITITDTDATVTVTGQGPYDGADDTLIGVVNNGRVPISTLRLNSTLPIFGFDGDGIVAFGISGNAKDTTGYGGPNAFFTNINSAQTQGDVNFIVPIAAHGGTGFFSLEDALASASTPCSSILNNSLSGPFLGASGIFHGPTQITASFTPKQGLTLAQAAQICGFVNFDWMQRITRLPDPSPFCEVNPADPNVPNPSPFCGSNLKSPFPIHLTSASVQFSDPAPNGYTYNPAWVSAPFYWAANTTGFPWSLDQHEKLNGVVSPITVADTLDAFDSPADFCISGPLGLPSNAYLFSASVRALCGHATTPRNSSIAFTTHLAGINSDGTGVDLGIGYAWTSNFNGTFGGISTTASFGPVDPDSGTGGIVITSVTQTTTFQSVNVTNVNGNAPGVTPPLTAGNACDGVFGGVFHGDVIVTDGQNCTFMNGTITGQILQRGGTLVLASTQVQGGIHIQDDSAYVIGPGVTIAENLEINGHGDEDAHVVSLDPSAQNHICSVTVNRNLHVQGSRIAVQIGSDSDDLCGGNLVLGNLQVENNRAAINVFDNAVTGNLIDTHNSGPNAVVNNNIGRNLQCDNNSSITGSGNEATRKDGQCSPF